jgi:general secretion pathway protein L
VGFLLELAQDIEHLNALRKAPGVVPIWEELARLLPQDTYLTEIDIKSRDLTIRGYSAVASDLPQLIEGSPLFADAALMGPVVFDQSKGKHSFTVRAALRTPRFAGGERG